MAGCTGEVVPLPPRVALADVGVTEWRVGSKVGNRDDVGLHSLMLVLLNGGHASAISVAAEAQVALADVGVTEWRRNELATVLSLWGCTR